MDSPQKGIADAMPNRMTEGSISADGGVPAIQEAALRQLGVTDPAFEIAVLPMLEGDLLWWRLVLRFPGDSLELRLVDARLKDRRWKQLNALARFVCRCCGSDRRLTVVLNGLTPDLLTTKGE